MPPDLDHVDFIFETLNFKIRCGPGILSYYHFYYFPLYELYHSPSLISFVDLCLKILLFLLPGHRGGSDSFCAGNSITGGLLLNLKYIY